MRFEIYRADNLNFVEFNITGNGDTLQRCNKDSLYLDTELFNLFSDCFESANNLYDYFGPNKYNYRNIVVLLNELKDNLKKLEAVEERPELIEYINQRFLGTSFLNELEAQDENWKNNWKTYLSKLVMVNKDLVNLVNQCIDEDRILWLIGY